MRRLHPRLPGSRVGGASQVVAGVSGLRWVTDTGFHRHIPELPSVLRDSEPKPGIISPALPPLSAHRLGKGTGPRQETSPVAKRPHANARARAPLLRTDPPATS
ncbi:hypothetical protein DPEC_G00308870 [Dallia pectoralis]|uniref:Uncharacterized protein n=1 Tax=Dallia pectoralis TaxID=75939 RepID=A0ACC2FES5_DALPE|nr:hypothetical protein DPEC_G00308870 [Dallia pectoralis]